MLIVARRRATLAANGMRTLSGLALLVFLPLIHIFKNKNTHPPPAPSLRTNRSTPVSLNRRVGARRCNSRIGAGSSESPHLIKVSKTTLFTHNQKSRPPQIAKLHRTFPAESPPAAVPSQPARSSPPRANSSASKRPPVALLASGEALPVPAPRSALRTDSSRESL